METVKILIDFVLHIDKHLIELVSHYQTWTYLILFLIIFAETGLVITPFLPGDSLLFATGAIVAMPETGLHFGLMGLLLIGAAFCGDVVNYQIGRLVGNKAFDGSYRLLKKSHLEKTHLFYEKHGGKTIVYARFVPVAGVGKMNFKKYITYGFLGSSLWVFGFLSLGFFFGNMSFVKTHFSLVALGIIGLSLVPMLVQFFKKPL